MSGGTYDYFFRRVEDIADEIHHGRDHEAVREAFRAHLRKVAKALQAIEWVDSGDYAPGAEVASILECLKGSRVPEEADR